MLEERGAAIAGVGAFVPEVVVTNQELEARMDTSDAWIREKIGIVERRIVREDQAMSDMAIPAAQEALADAGLGAEDVDMILVAGSNHDMLMPSTACIVQAALGARQAAAMDIRNACSGFVYALGTGAAFIQNGTCDTVLVIGAEIHSKIVDWNDPRIAPFFGDGGGAVVLRACRPGVGVLASYYGADGWNGDAIIVRGGGSRRPFSPEVYEAKEHLCTMDGKKVKAFVNGIFADSVRRALARAGLSVEDLDFLVAHQANINMIRHGLAELGLREDQTHTVLERYGNAGSASVPTVLCEAVRQGRIHPGDIVATIGYGAGLAYGANIIRWAAPEDFLPLARRVPA